MRTYTELGHHTEPGKEPEKGFIKAYHSDLRRYANKVLGAARLDKNVDLTEIGLEFLSACERGNPETLKIFIEAGMDVNYQHPFTGQTALHIASAAQARAVIRILLTVDRCDFLIRDTKGRLPSEMAYLYGEDPALARLLGNKERKQAEAQGIKLTRRPKPE